MFRTQARLLFYYYYFCETGLVSIFAESKKKYGPHAPHPPRSPTAMHLM